MNKALNLINIYRSWGMSNTRIVDKLAKGKCNSLKDLKYLCNIMHLSRIYEADIILNDKFSIHTNKDFIGLHTLNDSVSLIHYTSSHSSIFGGFIYVKGVDVKWTDQYYRHIIVQTYKLKNEFLDSKINK